MLLPSHFQVYIIILLKSPMGFHSFGTFQLFVFQRCSSSQCSSVIEVLLHYWEIAWPSFGTRWGFTFYLSSFFYNGKQPRENIRGQWKILKNILDLLINRLQYSLYSPSEIPQTLQCSAHLVCNFTFLLLSKLFTIFYLCDRFLPDHIMEKKKKTWDNKLLSLDHTYLSLWYWGFQTI